MGLLYEKAKTLSTTSSGGSLYERAKSISSGIAVAEIQPISPTPPIGIAKQAVENVSAFTRGEVPIKDIAKEIPAVAVRGAKAFADTFIPALTNFFKTTGSIIGEGLAYSVDKNVREQYQAGNLDILPTITETTPAKIAKATIAAGIETAVYRSFPDIAKMKIIERGGAGALQGVGFAIAEGLAHDKTPEEIIKSLPGYGVFGGIIGTLTPYLLPLLKSEIKALPEEMKSVFSGLKKEIKPPKPKEIPVVSEGEATRIPISTSNERYETYLRSQGYEPYIPEERLPIIEAGVTPKERLPIIQVEPPEITPSAAGKLIPEKPQKVIPTKEIPIIQAEEIIPETRITPVSKEQLPIGEGTTRVSRLESRIKGTLNETPAQKAEELGISTYKQMNKAETIAKSAKLADENPEEVMAILRGEKPIPEGHLYNSLALAMEKKAEIGADANLAIKLASLRSSRAGQEISILTEADPANPITQINEIIKARVGRATRKLKIEPTKEITKQINEGVIRMKKSQIQIAEAEKLLAEIVC